MHQQRDRSEVLRQAIAQGGGLLLIALRRFYVILLFNPPPCVPFDLSVEGR